MSSHLSDPTLDALLRGQLDPATLESVDTHLDTCAECRARLGSLARSGSTRGPALQSGPIEALEAAADPYVGATIAGRYRVHRRIGGGGMGNVYEAEHTLIGRRVALKVLLPQWIAHAEVVRRFQNEARAAGSLRHPGILAALDMGRTEEGTPFVVLELLEGRDLEERVEQDGPLPVSVAVAIGLRVAEALSVAHAAGIVHRDLKPENVFCTSDGGTKVLDFGISKITGALATGPATAPGQVMGTPMYMAPEQFEDAARADPRTDVYALGVLLYRCLTGELPHVAESLPALLMAVVSGEAATLREHDARLPEALDRAVMRALRPLPAERFPSMEAFAEALRPFGSEGAPEESVEPLEIDIELDVAAPSERRIAAILAVLQPSDPARVREAIEAHGGRAVAHDGGALLGVFGARSWNGDEPVRAVRAGLDARPFGGAVAVAAGRIEQAGEAVIGDAVGRALAGCRAQLSGVAVISPGTGIASRFELRQVDGPALVEVLGDRAAPLDPQSPLLGREGELSLLEAAIREVSRSGRGAALTVHGAMGMGKSRLLAEATKRARASGFLVFTARADPHTGLGIRDLAQQLAERVPLAAAALRAELAGSTPAPARANPSVMADRLELSLRAALDAITSYGPFALAIDDTPHCDPSLLRFLERTFADLFADRPTLLLGASRDAQLGWGQSLQLGPLARPELATWARHVLASPLPDERLDALLSLTEGNPQFVEETLAALVSAGGDGHIPLPLDVEAAVEARLEALSADTRELLEAGAVSFDRFDSSTLEALGVKGATHERLVSLDRAGWLRRSDADGLFEIASGLLAEVLYRGLPEARRAALHLRTATYLAGRPSADREWVAWHFDRADEREEAGREFARVALAAATRGDPARALRASERALELGVDEATAFALHLARAATFEHAGDLDAEGHALESARGLATTPEERARVSAASAVRALRRRGPLAARPAFDSALLEAERSDEPILLARAHGALAMALVALGELEEARASLARAQELIGTRAPSLVANLAGWQAQLAAAEGDLGARRTAFARARRLYLEQGDVRSAAGVSVNLGDALTRFGAYDDAIASLRDALSRCRALGIRRMEGYALANLGRALACVGDPEAATILDQATGVADACGDAHLATWVACYRALATAEAVHAERAAHAAFEQAELSDLEPAAIVARVLEVRAAVGAGERLRARRLLDDAIARRARLEGLEEGQADLFEVRVALLRAEGDADGAAEVLAKARVWLDTAAAWIADADLRARFVSDVPVHARLRSGEVRAFPP